MGGESGKETFSCKCFSVEEHLPCIENIEEILKYQFQDRKLVIEALTHPTFHYPNEDCFTYERLEFIGDAVLNCLMAMEFFFSYTELAPGCLTRLRSANVDTEKLARVAVKHNLHRHIRHKVPLVQRQVEEFIEAILEFPIHSNGLVNTPKLLADIVEALLGAVFVDSCRSLETVWKVFKGLLEPVIGPEMLKKHPMTELHELCQKKGLKLRFKREIFEDNINIDVFVEEHLLASACSHKKEISQNRAAKGALDKLKILLIENDTDMDSLSKSIASISI